MAAEERDHQPVAVQPGTLARGGRRLVVGLRCKPHAEVEERVRELEAGALVPRRPCPGFEPNDKLPQPGPVHVRGEPAEDDREALQADDHGPGRVQGLELGDVSLDRRPARPRAGRCCRIEPACPFEKAEPAAVGAAVPVERQGLKDGAGTVVEQKIAPAGGGEPAVAVGGRPAVEREAGALRLAPVGAAHCSLLRRCTTRGLQPARRPRGVCSPAGESFGSISSSSTASKCRAASAISMPA